MGAVGVPSRFVIDTKIKGFDEGSLTKDAIHKSIKGSLEDLGVDKASEPMFAGFWTSSQV